MCGATILKSCVPQYLQHKKLVTCTKIALCFYNHYEKDEIICHVYLYSVKKAVSALATHSFRPGHPIHVKDRDSIPFVGVLKRLFGERTEGRSLRKVVALYANLLISAFQKCQPCSVLEESGSPSLRTNPTLSTFAPFAQQLFRLQRPLCNFVLSITPNRFAMTELHPFICRFK